MSTSLILGAIWAIVAAITAMLPMRGQMIPGSALLLSAPVLLGYIAYQHGVWVLLLGLAAFLSMFRNPLKYLVRRAMGQPIEIPKEFRRDGK